MRHPGRHRCPIFAFGNLRHEQVMTSVRLFVQEVMPAVR
jgi:hypothetical protein